MVITIVSGTGTGIGKTIATAALASCARGRVAVVKPAQTGVAADEPGDLAVVTTLTGITDVHEYARYPDPLSPHHAAARSGLPTLDLDDVAARLRALAAERDTVFVEGAGGVLVPFADDGWSLLDLACELGAPVVIVTAAGLGTLNHTTLTLRVLREEGVTVAGLVIGSWPACPQLAERCNAADLAALSGSGGLVGVLPAGMIDADDFPAAARDALNPAFGGTFDSDAFVAAVSP